MNKRYQFAYFSFNYNGAIVGAAGIGVPVAIGSSVANQMGVYRRMSDPENRGLSERADAFNAAFDETDGGRLANTNSPVARKFQRTGKEFTDYHESMSKKYSNPLLTTALPLTGIAGGALLGARYLRKL